MITSWLLQKQTKEKELHPPVVQNKCYFSQAEVKFSLLRGVIWMSKTSQKPLLERLALNFLHILWVKPCLSLIVSTCEVLVTKEGELLLQILTRHEVLHIVNHSHFMMYFWWPKYIFWVSLSLPSRNELAGNFNFSNSFLGWLLMTWTTTVPGKHSVDKVQRLYMIYWKTA